MSFQHVTPAGRTFWLIPSEPTPTDPATHTVVRNENGTHPSPSAGEATVTNPTPTQRRARQARRGPRLERATNDENAASSASPPAPTARRPRRLRRRLASRAPGSAPQPLRTEAAPSCSEVPSRFRRVMLDMENGEEEEAPELRARTIAQIDNEDPPAPDP